VLFTTLGAVRQALRSLPATILRVKGFVCTEETLNRRVLLQMAGRRAALTFEGAWPEAPRTTLALLGLPEGPSQEDVRAVFDEHLAGAASLTS
jgi:G3E family GTPase